MKMSNANRFKIKQFYSIQPFENLPSILQFGLFSNDKITELGTPHSSIANQEIVDARRERKICGEKTVTHYACLYFWPRNPMLYKHTDGGRKNVDETAIIGVRKTILLAPGALISAGNARSPLSEIYPAGRIKYALDELGEAVGIEYWRNGDEGTKRKTMAELLIPEVVPREYIEDIFVASEEAKASLEELLAREFPSVHVPIVIHPHLFFRPERKIPLTSSLSLLKGDMFFSRMQTLTVSVNCVGVMGKGLASRAKYQFPDVYVIYQDLCKRGQMKLGKPYLYKREMDESLSGRDASNDALDNSWFLLFPTKDNWRNRADINGIEKGLEWVVRQYRDEGIQSLAVPALGCGNGWLEWKSVGPIICQYLSLLDIPVELYLPAEKSIPDEELQPNFLLSKARKVYSF